MEKIGAPLDGFCLNDINFENMNMNIDHSFECYPGRKREPWYGIFLTSSHNKGHGSIEMRNKATDRRLRSGHHP